MAKTKIFIYQNRRNPNKKLEVHKDSARHYSVRQFMEWEDTGIKNLLGDRKLHRWRKENLTELLEDYELVSL